MAGPYPLATLSVTIDETGISAPTLADILASLQASYQGIYGSDAVLDPSTQDGQWIAVQADVVNDVNNAAIAVYNSYSPATAVGAGLSSIVKTNGLMRIKPTNSTADLTLVGDAGVELTNAVVSDGVNLWALPSPIEFPLSGTMVQTATCLTSGAVVAGAGVINRIFTPTRGWASATNAASATVGVAEEQDGALRERQTFSTALPALTPLETIVGDVANLPGVTRITPFENDTDATDANGIPDHSISLVVEGGDAVQIATAIAAKKAPGTGTYGTTSEVIVDQNGVPNTIHFFRPGDQRVLLGVTITALTGYVSSTGQAIVDALVAFVNAIPIGFDELNINDLVAAAKLPAPLGHTYKINVGGMLASISPAVPAGTDIVITFNEAFTLASGDVALTVDT